jgi:uncharacterized BrkB/YihY/UPF0761 family membrane protein
MATALALTAMLTIFGLCLGVLLIGSVVKAADDGDEEPR